MEYFVSFRVNGDRTNEYDNAVDESKVPIYRVRNKKGRSEDRPRNRAPPIEIVNRQSTIRHVALFFILLMETSLLVTE